MVITDYLHDRTLQVVDKSQESRSPPVGASVPQRSVLGPVLWNLYIDDLLRTLPAVSAYTDDCTLSCSYSRQDSQCAVADVYQQLQAIHEWRERWQVNFAPEKTKAMVVSRSPVASQAVEGAGKFGPITLALQDHVKILGVTFDAELRFDKHIHHIAHQAFLRVSALRRVAGFLDTRGFDSLQGTGKAQPGV